MKVTKRPRLLDDNPPTESEDSSATCYSENDSVEEFDDEEEIVKKKKTAKQMVKPGAAFNESTAPPVKLIDLTQDDDVDMAVLDDTHDETKAAEMAYERRAIAEYLEKEEEAAPQKKKKARRATQLPSALDMAKELGVDWIGTIDPGSANSALCIYSAKQAQIVYWRVFALYELCVLCEKANNIVMCSDSEQRDALLAQSEPSTEKARKALEKQRNDLYKHDDRIYAIGWWCQQDTCPLKKCDLVLVERQSFDINMKSIEAAWLTAFVTHKHAVVAPCKINGGRVEYTLTCTKANIIGAESVKTHVRGMFPLLADEAVADHTEAAASAAAAKGKAAPRKRKQSGQRFVSRPRTYNNTYEDRSSPQYAANKKNAKMWCRILVGAEVDLHTGNLKSRSDEAMGEGAEADFTAAAVDIYKTMSTAEVAQTAARLGGAKADDLADVFFMALYGAEVLVPSLWKRVHGPLAHTYRSKWKLHHTPTASQMLVDPEAKHQSLFAYLKARVHLPQKTLDLVRKALSQ